MLDQNMSAGSAIALVGYESTADARTENRRHHADTLEERSAGHPVGVVV